MADVIVERTARKEHTCSRCQLPIVPGSRYREWKLTPDDSDAGTGRWQRTRIHFEYQDCISHPCGGRCPMVRVADDRRCCACEATGYA